MRALVQRVSEAKVTVEGQVSGEIGRGLLIFLGVKHNDTEEHANQLASKVIQLRIFPDAEGKMNHSVLDTRGDLLIVSQFTLYGETRKGNRPSYSQAAPPELAEPLYNYFVKICRGKGLHVATGIFRAHMKVLLVNDGPVTLLCHAED
jgi:D-tyrosyl-tRNA(Tyr) deacylase